MGDAQTAKLNPGRLQRTFGILSWSFVPPALREKFVIHIFLD
jgi:hypothetical protein